MTINLSALPAPQAVEELDFETIFAEQKAWVISQWPHLAPALELESEPMTVLLQSWSYRELVWRARLNDALKASMLAWAQGDDLLNLAAFFGLEKAEGETDDQLRARCTLSLRAMSTAGPEDSYRYHAIATDPAAIKDADAHNGGAGVVTVAVLARAGNGTPSAELLAKVRARLNHKTIRPLTDTVSVIPARLVPVVIDYQIVLPGLPDDEHSLNVARQRLADYCASTNIIGGTITIADIYASLKNAGISNVILRSPTTDITTDRESAPLCQQHPRGGDLCLTCCHPPRPSCRATSTNWQNSDWISRYRTATTGIRGSAVRICLANWHGDWVSITGIT
ncbi:baseplate assembly protein [Aeromonas veronii]|uniref:baseplate assembly protein n=1 Tax=Aeromonas veronii TaxID=654 RepID=UPI0024438D26|nr:baseplate J/gp47 family protein [Aeromonas veronii]